MNTESLACEIVDAVLCDLYDRPEFEDWWDSVVPASQLDIQDELVEIVKNILKEND